MVSGHRAAAAALEPCLDSMPSVIAHYQEIALKGKNRPWFLHRLIRNLRTLLSDLDVREIRTPMGRVEILLGPEPDWPEVRDRLSRAFGLANFSLARRTGLDLEGLAAAIVEHLPTETGRQLSRGRPPRRQDVSRSRRRKSSASSAVAMQDARGWPVDLSQSGVRDRRRDCAGRGVLLLRQDSRALAVCRSARRDASRSCCRGESIRRWRRGG